MFFYRHYLKNYLRIVVKSEKSLIRSFGKACDGIVKKITTYLKAMKSFLQIPNCRLYIFLCQDQFIK